MSDEDPNLHEEIAAGERWLSGFAAPLPSPQAVERVKQAIRAELAASPRRASRRRWAAWKGVLGAAAAVVLAVALSWHSVGPRQSILQKTELEGVASWIPENEGDAAGLALLDDDLSALEEWSASQHWSLGSSLYDALENALQDGGTTESGAMRSPPDRRRWVQETT